MMFVGERRREARGKVGGERGIRNRRRDVLSFSRAFPLESGSST